MRKRIGWFRKITGVLLSALAAWMIFSPTSQALRTLPETYRLNVGETYTLNVGVAVLSSADERLNLGSNTLKSSSFRLVAATHRDLGAQVREKLIRFIRDFREKNAELKAKEPGLLFDALARSEGTCESFWTAILEACPELRDDQGPCRRWVKRYLYEELEPSLKPGLLPANEGVRLSFIPETEIDDSGRWVDNMMAMNRSIVKDEEDIDLYISLNSDDAADTFIVLNMLDILISMPESGVHLKKIFTVRSLHRRMAGIIRDDTEGFGVAELFHGIRVFLNYGKADMIADIWKKSGESNESIAAMVDAMRSVDVGLSMCNMPEVKDGILRLRDLFRSEKFWRESGWTIKDSFDILVSTAIRTGRRIPW